MNWGHCGPQTPIKRARAPNILGLICFHGPSFRDFFEFCKRLDLENFFGTINFGRVRGFFIANHNFQLNPDVATILAQIACHENALPQGSPCSPVISNLIGHILDIRLAALAWKAGCSYSRYADDLTFSTNKRAFPPKVATSTENLTHQWQVGKDLEKIIKKTGFSINPSKTRMQYKDSRQGVTGLVVNTKVNTRVEYRRTVRAMVHQLSKTGSFQINRKKIISGTLDQLNGRLSFIDSVCVESIKRGMKPSDHKKAIPRSQKSDCNEKVYRNFLLYRNFFVSTNPLIICEGKTDNIYIKAAIQRLAVDYPALAEKKADGRITLRVKLFRYTKTTDRILHLAGGTGDFPEFIRNYTTKWKDHIKVPGKEHPVILLIDNDGGGKSIFNSIKKQIESIPDYRNKPFIFLGENLYMVLTPLTLDGGDTMIEDFFEESLKSTKNNGKSLNLSEDVNTKTEYGKHIFAKHVVRKNADTINCDGFKSILDRIDAVLVEHAKKSS